MNKRYSQERWKLFFTKNQKKTQKITELEDIVS